MRKSKKESEQSATAVVESAAVEPTAAQTAAVDNPPEKVPTYEEYQELRHRIRLDVRTRETFQHSRVITDNRLGFKADGKTKQNLSQSNLRMSTGTEHLKAIADLCRNAEDDLEEHLLGLLKKEPVYRVFLVNIRGIGPITAGHIISEFDIFKADTVSKMWQYSGNNPGMVPGKKSVPKGKYKKSMGVKIAEEVTKTGNIRYIVQTDIPIRGDKLTEGFVSPFNQNLRIALNGVMADVFIKSRSPYRKLYDDKKNQLEHSDKLIYHDGKMIPWKDASDGHRHNAAKRYMVKMFLADLYNAWRPCYGLSVRPSYQEEKLGHKHNIAAM